MAGSVVDGGRCVNYTYRLCLQSQAQLASKAANAFTFDRLRRYVYNMLN